jgi:hypothetical protein
MPIMAGKRRGFTFLRKNCGKNWRENPGYAEAAGGGISPNISSWHMSNVRWHIKSASGLWLVLEKSLNDACMNHKVYAREKKSYRHQNNRTTHKHGYVSGLARKVHDKALECPRSRWPGDK